MLVVLNIYPILQLFWISLTDFNSINWGRAKFVGVRNYIDLFTFDRNLTLTMLRGFYYLAGSIVQLVLATWFAVVLNQRLPGSRVFRTILFIPFVLNAVAAGLIFKNFLELSGAANDILQLFFGPDFKVTWLDSSEPYSNFSLAAASVWRYLGFNLVVTFGALQAIPQDQYDAAELEGANQWQQFWRITFSSIRLVLFLQLMLSLVGSLEVFEVPSADHPRRRRDLHLRNQDDRNRLPEPPRRHRRRHGRAGARDGRRHLHRHPPPDARPQPRARRADMSRRRPLTPARALSLGFQYFTLILISIIVLLPLWSLLVSSLKAPREYLDTNRIVPPQNWFNFSNYAEAIWPEQANGITIGAAFYNTGFILFCSLVLLILFGTSAAFAIDRFQFRGRVLILLAYGAARRHPRHPDARLDLPGPENPRPRQFEMGPDRPLLGRRYPLDPDLHPVPAWS